MLTWSARLNAGDGEEGSREDAESEIDVEVHFGLSCGRVVCILEGGIKIDGLFGTLKEREKNRREQKNL